MSYLECLLVLGQQQQWLWLLICEARYAFQRQLPVSTAVGVSHSTAAKWGNNEHDWLMYL